MEILQEILANKTIATIQLILGIILTISFIYFYIGKEGKDERGRGIFAKASFIALLSFMALVNLIAILINYLPDKMSVFATEHIMQTLFNVVLLIHIISTLILRKLR